MTGYKISSAINRLFKNKTEYNHVITLDTNDQYKLLITTNFCFAKIKKSINLANIRGSNKDAFLMLKHKELYNKYAEKFDWKRVDHGMNNDEVKNFIKTGKALNKRKDSHGIGIDTTYVDGEFFHIPYVIDGLEILGSKGVVYYLEKQWLIMSNANGFFVLSSLIRDSVTKCKDIICKNMYIQKMSDNNVK